MRALRVHAVLALALGLAACVSAPETLETPTGISAAKPDFLSDEEWVRVLAGEIVIAAEQSFDHIGLARAVMLQPLPADRAWRWMRDPRINPYFVSKLKSHALVSGVPGEETTVWAEVFDMRLLDISLWVRYSHDDESMKLTLSLAEGFENDIKDFANYFQILPTSHPGYDVVIMSAYFETGWWHVPAFVEKRLQRRSVMDIMRGIQHMASKCRHQMMTMEPGEWLAGLSPDREICPSAPASAADRD